MPIRSVCSRSLCFAVLAVASSIATGQSAVVTPYTSEQAFIAAAGGMVRQVDLEDVAAGTSGAFQSRGSNFFRAPVNGTGPEISVLRELLFAFHTNYFSMAGSSPQFMYAGLGFGARLPTDQHSAGFTLRSFSCPPGESSVMNWRLLDAADQVLSTGTAEVSECGSGSSTSIAYFGVHSSVAFRTVEFFRNSGSAFLVDDLATGPVARAHVQTVDSMPADRLLANFDDVAVGQSAPFTSGPITFSNTGTVENQIFSGGHANFFGAMASAPNFLATNFLMQLTAPFSVDSLGFVYRSVSSGPAIINLDTTDLAGDQLDSLAITAASAGPSHLTVVGLRPYRSARVRGLEVDFGYTNFLIDDVKVARIVLFADGLEGE